MDIQEDSQELINGELVIGLACATGSNNKNITNLLSEEFKKYGYNSQIIKVSTQLIEPDIDTKGLSAYERSALLMDRGNELRQFSKHNEILAYGVAKTIYSMRGGKKYLGKTVFIIDSLKHPAEVNKLREIYPSGFFLFVINETEEDRIEYLKIYKGMKEEEARRLVRRDIDEKQEYGQHTRKVFELADFHLSSAFPWSSTNVSPTQKEINLKNQIKRIISLLFGNPFITPTFDEYAMFMAYSSGLRSADLSRQVGAVITRDNEIIATGANDVPCYGGGQYWPDDIYVDKAGGRDYTIGWDSNKRELADIIDSITSKLVFDEENTEINKEKQEKVKKLFWNSRLKTVTEFGRPVHAEMSAIMSCARNGISLKDTTLYCSTFPCQNCAKHIIAAGIKKVMYIEPYPKSKTIELYNDSVSTSNVSGKVWFCEFVGIGPRRFYDLFSMGLSTGSRMQRKKEDGNIIDWNARLRCQMVPLSYIEREEEESVKWELRKIIREEEVL